jgi:tetratricopeptide (TPR) repeat protein
MESSEMDSLADRLVRNPHDEQALAHAHAHGASDPVAYANLLQRVGERTPDPAIAGHWLSEAANVWSTSLSDPRRAATLLMHAIERDPTHPLAASRLADLYRGRGDNRALVGLLEHRARAYVSLLPQHPHYRDELARMHEELGELWADKLGNTKKALENFRRAIEVDSSSRLAIYRARELCKDLGQLAEALPLYEAELWLETDLTRKVILLRDESAVRCQLGDVVGALRALEQARDIDPDDDALKQEFSSLVLETLEGGSPVSESTRLRATTLLVELAETYPGDHGLAYAGGALALEPGNDRALQLFVHYADAGGVTENVAERSRAYLEVNPHGPLADTARFRAAGAAGPRQPQRSDPPTGQHAIQNALRQASDLARDGQKDEALAAYLSVLEFDPAHPEALVWAEDELRRRREYARLRDVITHAVRAMQGPEAVLRRQERLRELSSLCELSLRDVDGAVSALKQLLSLDRRDVVARASLVRMLERADRFDDLANLYEQEALAETEIAKKIELESLVVALHRDKRKDPVAAADALERIARIAPEQLAHSLGAIEALLGASLWDRALELATSAASLAQSADEAAQLADARAAAHEGRGDTQRAAEAHLAAHELVPSAARLDRAESAFIAIEAWGPAAQAAEALARVDLAAAASHHYRAAEHWSRAGNLDEAIALLEPIVAGDERHEAAAKLLAVGYETRGRYRELVELLRCQARIRSGDAGVKLLKKVAHIEEKHFSSDEALATWRQVLELHEGDREALAWLADDAERRSDWALAAGFVAATRGAFATLDSDQAAILLLREGSLLERAGNIEGARDIIRKLIDASGPTREWLGKLVEFGTKLNDDQDVASSLQHLLDNGFGDADTRLQLSATLERLGDCAGALQSLGALDTLHEASLERAATLARNANDDESLALLLERQLDGKAKDSRAVLELAATLERLGRAEAALALLAREGADGDEAIRDAYALLGDRLGWGGAVGNQIVEWWRDAPEGQDRFDHLSSAVERWLKMSRVSDALALGTHLLGSRFATLALASTLERVAVEAHDYDTLGVAHDWQLAHTESAARPAEYVRQAEVRFGLAGTEEALAHGELGLANLPWAAAEPLIERLSKLEGVSFTALMERQLARSQPSEQLLVAVAWAMCSLAAGDEDGARRVIHGALPFGLSELALAQRQVELAFDHADDESREGTEVRDGILKMLLARFTTVACEDAPEHEASSALTFAASVAFSKLHDRGQAMALITRAVALDPSARAVEVLDEVAESRALAADIASHSAETATNPRARQRLLEFAYNRFLEVGQVDDASRVLEARYELAPQDAAIEQALALDLERRGEEPRLINLLERQLIRLREGEARSHLARRVATLRSKTSDLQEAIEAWRRVNRYVPGDEEAAREIEHLRQSLQAARELEAARDLSAPAASDSAEAPFGNAEEDVEEVDALLEEDDLLEGDEAAPSATLIGDSLDLEHTSSMPTATLLAGVAESAPALDLDLEADDVVMEIDELSEIAVQDVEEVRPRTSVPPPLPRT